jgi:hypothetical protein
MSVFGSRKSPDERSVKDCVHMVETFLRKVGLDPKAQRLDAPTVGWFMGRGSANLFVMIGDNDGTTILEVICPILILPSQNILPFYRRCLEINRWLMNCAICVLEDEVMLVSTRPARGLDDSELESTLDYLGAAADKLDNALAEEFGAKLWRPD